MSGGTSDQVPSYYHQLTQLYKSKRPECGSERTVKRRPWTAAPKASIHEVVLVVNGDHQTGLENIAKVHICLGIFSMKHDLARSCFKFWLKISDKGDKISRKKTGEALAKTVFSRQIMFYVIYPKLWQFSVENGNFGIYE